MKTTLFSVASAAVVSLASTASAQSVLERVLGTVDNATNLSQVSGTYANIAESVGTVMMPVEVTTPEQLEINPDIDPSLIVLGFIVDDGGSDVLLPTTDMIGAGPIESSIEGTFFQINEDLSVTLVSVADGFEPSDFSFIYTGSHTLGDRAFSDVGATVSAEDTVFRWTGSEYYLSDRAFSIDTIGADTSDLFDVFNVLPGGTETIYVPVAAAIDGSITNIVTGIDGATQEALAGIDVSAIEWDMPTLNFGDMATTALGAVNTGDITLGVNSAIDEAATSTTRAISAVVDQIGGSADAGAIVLNVASNMNAVNGSINNALAQVNGSIGDLSTTALGAVNTGVIISGVDSAVRGIVGMSGAKNAALN